MSELGYTADTDAVSEEDKIKSLWREGKTMKKNIGAQLALYPMPLTVIGAMNGAQPTWTLVAHVGIIGHDHLLVSLASAHFINAKI